MLKNKQIYLGNNAEEDEAIQLFKEISEQKITSLIKYMAKLNLAQIYSYNLYYAKAKELYLDVLLNSKDQSLQIQAKKGLINIYLFAADAGFQNDNKAVELLKDLSQARDFPTQAKEAKDM